MTFAIAAPRRANVIPAKAGIQRSAPATQNRKPGAPAFAGVTKP